MKGNAMKQLVCEMCGNTDLTKLDGVFVCQSCGCKYSVEEARKMMVEGPVDVSGSTVKVDDTSKLENYLEIAENAIKSNNCREAEQYRNKALEVDPHNYEAWLLKGRSVLWQSTAGVSKIPEAISLFKKALSLPEDDTQREAFSQKAASDLFEVSMILIKRRAKIHAKTVSCGSAELLKSALAEFENYVFPFFRDNLGHDFGRVKETFMRMCALEDAGPKLMSNTYILLGQETLNWITRRGVYKLDLEKSKEMLSRLMADVTAKDCFFEFIIRTDMEIVATIRDKNYHDEYKKAVIALLKDAINNTDQNLFSGMQINSSLHSAGCSKLKELSLKWERYLKILDPSYEPKKPETTGTKPNTTSNASSTTNGGCYVATAVYGSYDCPQVWTLRRYRDYTLAETWYGRAFIRVYYAISPTLVKWFGHTEWFKKMWKGKLDRMVANLNTEGVVDTPYEDRIW